MIDDCRCGDDTVAGTYDANKFSKDGESLMLWWSLQIDKSSRLNFWHNFHNQAFYQTYECEILLQSRRLRGTPFSLTLCLATARHSFYTHTSCCREFLSRKNCLLIRQHHNLKFLLPASALVEFRLEFNPVDAKGVGNTQVDPCTSEYRTLHSLARTIIVDDWLMPS